MSATLPLAAPSGASSRPRYGTVRNYVGGAWADATGAPLVDVHSPGDGRVIARTPLSSAAEVDAAVAAASAALPAWSALPIKERVQVLYRYRTLLEQQIDELSELIVEEHGKVVGEARAEVLKAIELTEFACSLPQIATGEALEVSRGVECRTERYPVGVVASIAPFNFPSMVPHWTIPNAVALGNCMVLKPSELVPLSAGRIAELLARAGLPAGVFNVVHGGQAAAEAICDHPGIAAVTFVGSTRVAQAVYRRGTASLKRVLALGGAKNHLIVMPDAEPEMTSSNVAASMSGCSGQRCMAASVMVAVSGTDDIVRRVVEHARRLVPGETLGPVISQAARERIERYVTDAEAAGARVLLDGRGAVVPGREGGFYVGPTVLDQVTPEMRIAQEEVFGPVLAIVRAPSLDAALDVERRSPYGNAAAVFTERGATARYVAERATAGMVGVNVGVPVPREPFGFGGWGESAFGVGDITGKGSIEFWTRTRKTTTKWNREAGTNWMS
ncbi:MAG: Possible malonate-semialdehyde dehydrogenase in pyrimidine catabolism [uncultured Gemmatimonadaceae bacterium]|uniref:Possible malonate-semialdehyde dehydrogenase in pyrimidine catabolism n=1 Tax=uncultured Gemmatimonadaceae bacterium TaxID=246130 RepID=A0A6J4LI27_9BACT|nr:MAG: Possible malonate-semialdehyde dehydrogenase in pyrimidine catabolism [uncultured Gemmatimonadaceae bacterium]